MRLGAGCVGGIFIAAASEGFVDFRRVKEKKVFYGACKLNACDGLYSLSVWFVTQTLQTGTFLLSVSEDDLLYT